MGPKQAHSTVLTVEEEALIVTFRRHTLLPLDDCLYALQDTLPHLTRSLLHRCLQRHGISRLPDLQGDKPKKKQFKQYPIGFFHIDIAQMTTAPGKSYLFVAIDRTSKLVFARLLPRATRANACGFLKALLAHVPYHIHTVLTDNGIQFTNLPHQTRAFTHLFDHICKAHGIEHRLTNPNHSWTNGQVERMNRTLKEATVHRYFYATVEELEAHLQNFLAAYNFAKRLKTLKGLTPFEFICRTWQTEPHRFTSEPFHLNLGLYT